MMAKKTHLTIKNAKWAYHVRDEHKKHLFGVWGVTPHISLEKNGWFVCLLVGLGILLRE